MQSVEIRKKVVYATIEKINLAELQEVMFENVLLVGMRSSTHQRHYDDVKGEFHGFVDSRFLGFGYFNSGEGFFVGFVEFLDCCKTREQQKNVLPEEANMVVRLYGVTHYYPKFVEKQITSNEEHNRFEDDWFSLPSFDGKNELPQYYNYGTVSIFGGGKLAGPEYRHRHGWITEHSVYGVKRSHAFYAHNRIMYGQISFVSDKIFTGSQTFSNGECIFTGEFEDGYKVDTKDGKYLVNVVFKNSKSTKDVAKWVKVDSEKIIGIRNDANEVSVGLSKKKSKYYIGEFVNTKKHGWGIEYNKNENVLLFGNFKNGDKDGLDDLGHHFVKVYLDENKNKSEYVKYTSGKIY